MQSLPDYASLHLHTNSLERLLTAIADCMKMHLPKWYRPHYLLSLAGRPVQSWWRHQVETFSALLALCAGTSPVTGEFLLQRPGMRSFDAFFDLRLNTWLSKQSWGWWFEMSSCPLWRHCNDRPWWVWNTIFLWASKKASKPLLVAIAFNVWWKIINFQTKEKYKKL